MYNHLDGSTHMKTTVATYKYNQEKKLQPPKEPEIQ